jgi:UDP-N-acetylmuramoyl-tripeptide--D-alanyl-D-alanine ligase
LSAFASEAFKGRHFEDLDLLKIALLEEGKSSDLTILVKGSRSSQMDLVVDMLLAENS